MNPALAELAARIREECLSLESIVARIASGWERAKQSSDDLYLDGVALNLHGFYNGLERLFELIAAVVDKAVPTGENSHQVLLQQMTAELHTLRPAVISESSARQLNEYRRFRHIVRHVYTFKFDPNRIEQLINEVPTLFNQVRAEMLAFADFLVNRAQ